MTGALSPTAARRVFLALTFPRWFPVGLVVGVITLWILDRGLTVSQALLAFSLQGIVVFLLELPTSGFADAHGPYNSKTDSNGLRADTRTLCFHSRSGGC